MNNPTIRQQFKDQLSVHTNEELVDRFNGGVGISAWNLARAAWVSEMGNAFDVRGIDRSAITNETGGLNLNKQVDLVGNTLVVR